MGVYLPISVTTSYGYGKRLCVIMKEKRENKKREGEREREMERKISVLENRFLMLVEAMTQCVEVLDMTC